MTPEHHSFTVSINPSPIEEELSVLFSGEAVPFRLHKTGPATHDYYLVHTVLSGFGDFTIGGRSYRCGAGDTFIIFPGELFTYQADGDEPWSYAWVAFVGYGAAAAMAKIGVSPGRPIVPDSLNPNVRNDYEQLRRCFDSASYPELSNLEAGGRLRLLLQRFGVALRKLENSDPEPTLASSLVVKQAIQYLTLQFTQPISIGYLAGTLGYHRTHLCKLFKQSTGLSPMRYLLNIRMQRAELLLATPITIDQVASSVGFGDALYFSKKFRQWSGQSPSEYRKALRNHPKRPVGAYED
ncbi:helix-turn-helix transcriptional regulator [Cohnella cholangitidis]|uniref:AraC family transcriptional regulator n=1 Tax=Cohnella cholangitidis TaxID=2598458 RepID=A0A7G5C1J5_9BACL|nr:AraC family transcriptional regulator [Cohnella cholangitidis]QMV43079.1 AraC family transcriptional regulator [Cohnella cholangitidis]